MTDLTPDRLYPTEASYEDEHTDRKMTVRVTVDLEEVRFVRELCDYDAGSPQRGFCGLEYRDGSVLALRDSYDAVQAALVAYRRHADKLARLRN